MRQSIVPLNFLARRAGAGVETVRVLSASKSNFFEGEAAEEASTEGVGGMLADF
jgi:hypothetical protein